MSDRKLFTGPEVVLSRCEWGHDDYRLNVRNLPMAGPAPEVSPAQRRPTAKVESGRTPPPGQGSLFEEEA